MTRPPNQKDNMKHKKVVTWQACVGNGASIGICNRCAMRLRAARMWPRHPAQGEYGHISRGQHAGSCDLCDRTGNVAESSVLAEMAFQR